MPQKPPAFQFYAKDWMTSQTVRSMSRKQRGAYIDLLAAAWQSEEPGTLPAPVELAARCAGLDVRCVIDLFTKFPSIFVLDRSDIRPKFVNEKLHNNWLRYKEISKLRAKSAEYRHHANAEQKHMQTASPAPALAPSPKKESKGNSSSFSNGTREIEAYGITKPRTDPETLSLRQAFRDGKLNEKIKELNSTEIV